MDIFSAQVRCEPRVGSDHQTGGICGLQDAEVRQSEIGEVVPKSDLPGGNMNLVKDADNFRKCSEVLPRQESFASLAHTNPTRQRGL